MDGCGGSGCGVAEAWSGCGFVGVPAALALRGRRRGLTRALGPTRRRCWARAASRPPRAIFVWSAGDALFRGDDDDTQGGGGDDDGDGDGDGTRDEEDPDHEHDDSRSDNTGRDDTDHRALEERLFDSRPGGNTDPLGSSPQRHAQGDAAHGEVSHVFATSQPTLDPAAGRNVLYDALRTYSTGPDQLDRMKAEASDAANDAFKRTVLGIVGALPSEAYEVTITSDRTGLARLMHSSLCTGYALRNAEFRLALNDALNDAHRPRRTAPSTVKKSETKPAAPKRGRPGKKSSARSQAPADTSETDAKPSADGPNSELTTPSMRTFESSLEQPSTSGDSTGSTSSNQSSHDTDEPEYMRNVPFRGKVDSSSIQGHVKWWDYDLDSKQEMSATDYVAKLESENELLRDRLKAKVSHSDHAGNRILEFMKTLSAEKIAGLQRDISPLSEEAFRLVLISVLGELNSPRIQATYSTNRDYMAQITLWCLLAGYTLRNVEKKNEMKALFTTAESLDSTVSHAQTPPSPPSSSQGPPQTPPSL